MVNILGFSGLYAAALNSNILGAGHFSDEMPDIQDRGILLV